jgi:hypothetical protein
MVIVVDQLLSLRATADGYGLVGVDAVEVR